MLFELTRLFEWQFPAMAEAMRRDRGWMDVVLAACPRCGLQYAAPRRAPEAPDGPLDQMAAERLAAECPDHPAHFDVG